MAKYRIENFKLTQELNEHGYPYFKLRLSLVNSKGNPTVKTYSLHEDVNHSLEGIGSFVSTGLELAKNKCFNIEISENLKRMYVYFAFYFEENGKFVKKLHKYTAHKLK